MNRAATTDLRLQQLQRWLAALPASLRLQPDSLRPASADASFRRYFLAPAMPPIIAPALSPRCANQPCDISSA